MDFSILDTGLAATGLTVAVLNPAGRTGVTGWGFGLGAAAAVAASCLQHVA
jgi:hypothetical protein